MAIQFPQNPDDLDEHTEANKTWQWQVGVNAWVLILPGDNLAPPVTLINTLPSEVPLLIRGAPLQTANLWQIEVDGGSVVYAVSSTGQITSAGGQVVGTVSNPPVDASTGDVALNTNNNFFITATGDLTIDLNDATAGQSGFVYVDNTGDHIISFDAALLFPGGVAPTLDVGIHLLGYYSPDGVLNIITSVTELSTA